MLNRRQAQEPGIGIIKTGWEVRWFEIEAVDEVRVSGACFYRVLDVIGTEVGLTALMS